MKRILLYTLSHTAFLTPYVVFRLLQQKISNIYKSRRNILHVIIFKKPVDNFLNKCQILKQQQKIPYVLTLCRALCAGPEHTEVSVLKELMI